MLEPHQTTPTHQSAPYTLLHTFFHITYQIRQRIQLLPHQTALLPPPRHHTIKEVEEHAQRHEGEGEPEAAGVAGVDAVAHGGGDGHEAAEAVHERDEVGQVVRADEGEVPGVGGVEEDGLFVFCCYVC